MNKIELHKDLIGTSWGEVRRAIRSGRYDRHTAGLAPGKLQANLVILPEAFALDFLRFCQRNPKSCPVVGVTDTGDPHFPTLGEDIDLRSDVPRYRIYENGQLFDANGQLFVEVTDISAYWRKDLVAIAIGCSFTFERALIEAGIPMRHIDEDYTVPMFRTTVDCVPAGRFSGGMVVSMRPIQEDDVPRVIEICRRYPLAHGAPVHVGDPVALGITDFTQPDWGDTVEIRPGELPVFWACGVTPQNVLQGAGIPFFISHAPGHMLITDIDERAEFPILSSDINLKDREETNS